MPPDVPRLLTSGKLARRLRVPVARVLYLLRRGDVRPRPWLAGFGCIPPGQLPDCATFPTSSTPGERPGRGWPVPTEPTPVEPLLLNAISAARALSLSMRTLWSLTAPRGPIPVVRIGKRCLHSRAGLQRWIDEQAKAARCDGGGR